MVECHWKGGWTPYCILKWKSWSRIGPGGGGGELVTQNNGLNGDAPSKKGRYSLCMDLHVYKGLG